MNDERQPPPSNIRPDGRGGACGMETLAKVPARQVYLFCRGNEIEGRVVDADLHDDMWLKNPKIPLDLEICCPRCSQQLHIDGHKKTIHARYREPRRFTHPVDGDLCVQTVIVSIEEELACSHPVGKGVCGIRFRITENVLHRI